MSLDFPWQMFIQAQQAKNQNRQQMNQDIGSLGQAFGQGLQGISEQVKQAKQKQLMDQLVMAMKNQGAPKQGPQMPPIQGPSGYMPPGISSGTPVGQSPTPLGPAQDNTQQIQSLMMQLNPDTYMKDIYPKTLKKQMGGVGKRVVYQSPDGSISLTPMDGATPLEVSDSQAMQYTAVPRSSKEKNQALGSRAEAMQRNIDTRQVDQLVSRTGLTPKMQSQLQMNTMRALRSYVPILSRPRITYQELALGEMDLAGIMHGGVPQRDELVNTHFPGWQEKWSNIKTYALGHPQEMVPPDIQEKVKQMVGDVVKIDNTFLQANKKFSKTMLGPTIRGGLSPTQNTAIDEMVGALTPKLGEGSNSDISSMSTEELQRIAARR